MPKREHRSNAEWQDIIERHYHSAVMTLDEMQWEWLLSGYDVIGHQALAGGVGRTLTVICNQLSLLK